MPEPEGVQGRSPRAARELNPVAGRELSCQRQIGTNHHANLRIATSRLSIGHEENRLARGGHLQ